MADDKDSKTEEATPKKLRDAQEQGQVLQSQEIKNWFAFLGMVAILLAWIKILAGGVSDTLVRHLSNLDRIPMDGAGLTMWVTGLVKTIAVYMTVPAAVIMIFAIIANRVQHPITFTIEKLKPKFDKLNFIKGMKKFVSSQILIELVKTVLKLIVVFSSVFMLVFPQRAKIERMLTSSPEVLLQTVYDIVLQLFIVTLLLITIIAAIDYAYQRYKYYENLKMSKQEIKDENKQSDGDPMVKGRLRKIRMERSMQRMMANVQNADVVITNPTHFAIALEYKHGQMDVPVLLAKGADNIAMKIREVAEENGIPLLENPPLARLLYATVEIDQEIPPEHYKAVAGVISHIMKLSKTRVNSQRTRS